MAGDKQVSDESLYNKRKDRIVGMRSFIDEYKQTKEKHAFYIATYANGKPTSWKNEHTKE